MIWLLLVIMLIVIIVAVSRSGKKQKVETESLMHDLELKKNQGKSTSMVDKAEELKAVKALLDEGVFTQEEYKAEKARILGQ